MGYAVLYHEVGLGASTWSVGALGRDRGLFGLLGNILRVWAWEICNFLRHSSCLYYTITIRNC